MPQHCQSADAAGCRKGLTITCFAAKMFALLRAEDQRGSQNGGDHIRASGPGCCSEHQGIQSAEGH